MLTLSASQVSQTQEDHFTIIDCRSSSSSASELTKCF
jgi:hypothetical protein